ncbi:MAG TPA: acylneuraminate cytidylyltransferase family protein [Flavobacterium sp.]|nr:acylneuraminate cytidylyltransferase family protein [Flavobacterium sp.]
MKNIAIIPARGGSKRLPGKNILPLNGLPLIAHSILYAQKNSIIDAVYVSTDNDGIAKVALDFGAKVIHRPSAISGDEEPTVSALKHVLENLDFDVDNVILLQPTNPLRPATLLAEAFGIYKNKNCDSLFTVTRNHHKFGKISGDKFLPYNYEPGQRSQDLEPLFFENGLLYISKSSLIMNDKIISENAFPLEVGHPFANVDIDTQADFDYAAYLMNLKTDHEL